MQLPAPALNRVSPQNSAGASLPRAFAVQAQMRARVAGRIEAAQLHRTADAHQVAVLEPVR